MRFISSEIKQMHYQYQGIRIEICMTPDSLRHFKTLCNKLNAAPIPYPMYPTIVGPNIQGYVTSINVNMQQGANTAAIELQKDSMSFIWGLAFLKEVCQHFELTRILYDFRLVTKEKFCEINPYRMQINMHSKVLQALDGYDSPIEEFHRTRMNDITMVLDTASHFAKALFAKMITKTPQPVVV